MVQAPEEVAENKKRASREGVAVFLKASTEALKDAVGDLLPYEGI